MDKIIDIIDREGRIHKNQVHKKRKPEENLSYLKYANIGFYLVTPLVAGVFLGLWLDSKFNSKPVLTISFIVLGAIGTFYNLIKLTKE